MKRTVNYFHKIPFFLNNGFPLQVLGINFEAKLSLSPGLLHCFVVGLNYLTPPHPLCQRRLISSFTFSTWSTSSNESFTSFSLLFQFPLQLEIIPNARFDVRQ